LSEAVEGWGRDGAAKGAGGSKAEIVDQNEKDVGSAVWSRDVEPFRGLDIAGVGLGVSRAIRLRNGQNGTINACGYAGQ
jgi:hypothetical protein